MGSRLNCPQCNQEPHKHDDSACIYRYYHDEIHEEYGWIAGDLIDLIPGEILSDEKAIIHHKLATKEIVEMLSEELEKAA